MEVQTDGNHLAVAVEALPFSVQISGLNFLCPNVSIRVDGDSHFGWKVAKATLCVEAADAVSPW